MEKTELICLEKSQSSSVSADELPYIFVTNFDDAALNTFYQKFTALHSNPDVKVIPIVVSSFGGQVHTLLAMIDIINSSAKPVATIGTGKAMSCGAILLASGTKGYRFAAPNTDIMLHEISSMEWGKITDTDNGVRQTKRLNIQMFKHLAKQARKKGTSFFLKEMKKRVNVDWYLTPSEYKKLGLIDHISMPILVKGIVE